METELLEQKTPSTLLPQTGRRRYSGDDSAIRAMLHLPASLGLKNYDVT